MTSSLTAFSRSSFRSLQPFRSNIHGKQIECVTGSIRTQTGVGALVLPAQTTPKAALSAQPQPGLILKPGQAVIARNQPPDRSFIYVLGPAARQHQNAAFLLALCYTNTLELAQAHQIGSVAFPPISIGSSGFSFLTATKIACDAVIEALGRLNQVQRVRFVFSTPLQTSLFLTLARERIEADLWPN